MKRRMFTCSIAIACAALACAGAHGIEAVGVVYNDRNGNGMRDPGEKGLPNVLVSNGVDIVKTGAGGQYRLSATDDTTFFVIKPAGWTTPTGPGNNIPRFYYIHKPKGSPAMKYAGVAPTGPLPASIDFPLRRQKESARFRMICFGDTQTRDIEEVEFVAHDLLEDLAGTDAAFGVTLGDIVFNDLSVFEPLVAMMSRTGIPWRYVPGNHDHHHDAPTPENADDAFERVFGPPYYAFNYGKVHFIVLNDIRHEAGREEYRGGLGERQRAFVKNDLAHVSPDRLIVLLMHIPIHYLDDRTALYELLKDFPHTFSISAHTHRQEHVFLGHAHGWPQSTPHHHLINATACGSWWGGFFGETGIPETTMSDGAPNGYSIVSFDGTKYAVEFRAAQRPPDYQMSISLPGRIAAANLRATQPVVNVFAGSSRSTVEMRVDGAGAWTPMQSFTGKDPYYCSLYGRQEFIVRKWAEARGAKEIDDAFIRKTLNEFEDVFRRFPKPADTPHLWRANLPDPLAPGPHTLEVRTRDMFGQTYTARRYFVVE
ncbi:MAG TPA: calcineurin-like phosphoesterase family protein [Candidatus Hydrogenedentes bacterium]|nr:calcineurin-like phosphoesterase family protein [Candidatus Hydrogenedentota bacterium]HPC16413.1 calcineurin-like phosphoesterase family protein [Candidatus Hydrogenedentota bacterium]HRT20346.1 calcineurin-like phosphoesterase family protein [Candidatus Hydrogenedentota bacterium]HRT65072.1 calcineurin-like phosphoesterase family protein [Candidatus Hydrogenedentota bacterium]